MELSKRDYPSLHQSGEDVSNLSNGPNDTLIERLSWLNVAEIGEAMRVSRRWASFGGSDVLWRPLYIRRFGSGKHGAGVLLPPLRPTRVQQQQQWRPQRQQPQHHPMPAPTITIAPHPPPLPETQQLSLPSYRVAPLPFASLPPAAAAVAMATTAGSSRPAAIHSGSSAKALPLKGNTNEGSKEDEGPVPLAKAVDEQKAGDVQSEVAAAAAVPPQVGAIQAASPETALDAEDGDLRLAFRARLTCPMPGDHVQVAWRGKFRLDANLVFTGVSWWDAKVMAVELNPDVPVGDQRPAGSALSGETLAHHGDGGAGKMRVVGGKLSGANDGWDVMLLPRPVLYRVHYRSWSRRWDEWVEPSMLRWKHGAWNSSARTVVSPRFSRVGTGTGRAPAMAAREKEKFSVNQPVELYCHGDMASGAWLDARVRKVAHNSVCLSDMSKSSQLMWVCPDRIRAKPAAPPTIAAIARKAYGGAIPAGVEHATDTMARNEQRGGSLSRVLAFAGRRGGARGGTLDNMSIRNNAAGGGGGLHHNGESVEITCCIV